jgi:hypothetical protein
LFKYEAGYCKAINDINTSPVLKYFKQTNEKTNSNIPYYCPILPGKFYDYNFTSAGNDNEKLEDQKT